LSRRDYKLTINTTLDKLRQEQAIYTIQTQTSNTKKKTNLINNDLITNTEEIPHTQYMKGRNFELLWKIGKRLSYLL